MGNTQITGRPVDVNRLALQHLPAPSEQIATGAPTTGVLRLDRFMDLNLGVWEMSAGGMHDVEADEVFVVTAGRATVEFQGGADGSAPGAVELGPGTLMRLNAGMRTTWTVHETLRKVYLTP